MTLLPVDPQKFLVFLGVTLVLCWVPGPANLFAVANGMERGPKAALLATLGMNLATLVWFIGAALGLGALIAAFPAVFRVLAFAGAAYVAWLGFQALRAAYLGKGGPTHSLIRPGRSALRDGFMVQIANPKCLLYFTAVLPPFIDLHRALLPQLVVFALSCFVLDGMSMTTYGLSGAALADRMTEPRFQRLFSAAVGGLLVLAAILIAARA